jgi:hypothetical protein
VSRGQRSRACLLLLAATVLGTLGCGHDVTATAEFRDPASLPMAEELTGFPTAVGVNLDWIVDPGVFAIIDGWNIYRAEGDLPPPAEAYKKINPGLFVESMYFDMNVVDGILYWYRLTSMSPAGVEGLPTDPIAVRVDFSPPSPPTGVQVEMSGGRVHVYWDLHPERLVHFNVFRTPPEPAALFGPVPESLPEYFDPGVVPGTTYRYWVTAVDLSLNESAASETVSVQIPLASSPE